MMASYTISYYGHQAKSRTATGAIRVARKLVRAYGQGNRNPVIDADSEDSLREMDEMQRVAHTDYSLRLDGVAAQ
jgi:hypothetical protein